MHRQRASDRRIPQPRNAVGAAKLRDLEQQVRALVSRVAAEEGLHADISELYRLEPVPMDASLTGLLERAAESAGARHKRLASGAGHDAMALGQHVRTGMVFVPSCGGISHSPVEETPEAHCDLGARVLAHALKLLDREL